MRLKFHHLIVTAGAVLSVLLFLSLCPLTLKRIPSNYINTAVDGYYFQYHRLTHVRHRKNWFRPSVRGIIDGTFFEVDATAPWRAAFSSNKPGITPAAVTQPNKRPTIVTLQTSDENSGVVAAWKRAWFAAGFNPVVDAETDNSLQHKLEAAARHDALIYCDQHILPIDFRPNLPGGRMEEEFSESREKNHRGDHHRWRPNEYMPDLYDDNDVMQKLKGAVVKTTVYSQIEESVSNGLIHFESNEYLRDMVQKLSSERVSSSEAANDFRVSMENTRALAVYTAANLETLTGYSSLKDETVSHMISAHKRNMFSAVFSNGLQVVDPYEGMSQIFSLPSLRLAQRLGACPTVPLAKTCPPTAPILAYFKQHQLVDKSHANEDNELSAPKLSEEHIRELRKLGCIICQDQSQIRLLRAYNLRPRTFKIGTLAHPLTRVAAEHVSTDVDIEMVYDSSTAYESWVHNVTHRVISSDRFGSVPKVLMMKDILYKSFFEQSNSIWLTWEDSFVPSVESNDDIEYHLGFVLPPEPEARVHVKSFKSIGEGLVSPHEFFNNGETIMKTINARLHNDDGNDSILNTVEGWNIPDTEVWRFLQELKSLHRADQTN